MTKKIRLFMQAYCDEDNYNAQNLNAREMARRLDSSRFNVTLLYLAKPDRKLLTKKNVRCIRARNLHGRPIRFITFLSELRRFFEKGDLFFFPRFLNGYIYLTFRKLLGDKKVNIYSVENIVTGLNRSTCAEFIERSNLYKCDYVYSNSKYVAETVKRNYNIKTPVIYTGVNTKIFVYLPRRKKDRLDVLYVGSFQQRKRPFLVLEAAKRFRNMDFDLVGSGPLQGMLLNMKERFNLKNVRIHGHLPLNELVSLMQKADIFLFPSVREGFPKVTIEAAATGLPTIVFNDYKPETVIDGETGFIVGNIEEMMDKLEILMGDCALRREMGIKAREHGEKFDWEIIVKQWEKEFEMVLEKNEC
ncbi:MAG: glycosyltransferase family 4 protein [Candidatus Bathyarchaeota archaeon]|nr:glycosyltransferase family 4 protein [Candidatus Bathyarchaeota archaeon]